MGANEHRWGGAHVNGSSPRDDAPRRHAPPADVGDGGGVRRHRAGSPGPRPIPPHSRRRSQPRSPCRCRPRPWPLRPRRPRRSAPTPEQPAHAAASAAAGARSQPHAERPGHGRAGRSRVGRSRVGSAARGPGGLACARPRAVTDRKLRHPSPGRCGRRLAGLLCRRPHRPRLGRRDWHRCSTSLRAVASPSPTRLRSPHPVWMPPTAWPRSIRRSGSSSSARTTSTSSNPIETTTPRSIASVLDQTGRDVPVVWVNIWRADRARASRLFDDVLQQTAARRSPPPRRRLGDGGEVRAGVEVRRRAPRSDRAAALHGHDHEHHVSRPSRRLTTTPRRRTRGPPAPVVPGWA